MHQKKCHLDSKPVSTWRLTILVNTENTDNWQKSPLFQYEHFTEADNLPEDSSLLYYVVQFLLSPFMNFVTINCFHTRTSWQSKHVSRNKCAACLSSVTDRQMDRQVIHVSTTYKGEENMLTCIYETTVEGKLSQRLILIPKMS